MAEHQAHNIQSKLLKNHWDIMGSTYLIAKQKNLDDGKNNAVFEFLKEEWERIYPTFVLHPVKSEVMDRFYFAQTKGFEREKQLKEEITVFRIYYYLYQYFSLKIEPNVIKNYDIENYPQYDMHYGDANQNLYDLFAELWDEINSGNDLDAGSFYEYDLGEFYERELNLLQSFLADCWNETKVKTQSTVIAILSETIDNYLLDEKRILTDTETEILDRQ